MIKEFVERWEQNKEALRNHLIENPPYDYVDILNSAVYLIQGTKDQNPTLDVERITTIDHGDYQGTKLFIIGSQGYQPRKYYSVYVDYGSCSGCDSFQMAKDDYLKGSKQQIDAYMLLALHMVQNLKEIGSNEKDFDGFED